MVGEIQLFERIDPCDQTFEDMPLVGKDTRLCRTCDTGVVRVYSNDEMDRAIEAGLCVAVASPVSACGLRKHPRPSKVPTKGRVGVYVPSKRPRITTRGVAIVNRGPQKGGGSGA